MPIGLPRVVHEEAAAGRVIEGECESEQASFAAAQHERGQVEEIGTLQLSAADDADARVGMVQEDREREVVPECVAHKVQHVQRVPSRMTDPALEPLARLRAGITERAT